MSQGDEMQAPPEHFDLNLEGAIRWGLREFAPAEYFEPANSERVLKAIEIITEAVRRISREPASGDDG